MTRAPTSTSTWSSPTAVRSTRRPTAATRPRRSRSGQAFLKTVPAPGHRRPADQAAQPGRGAAQLVHRWCPGRRATTRSSPRPTAWDAVRPAVDIPGAKKLLAEAGVDRPDRRPAACSPANNPRRANEYELIKASAPAGRLQPDRRPEARAGARSCRTSTATTHRSSAGRPPRPASPSRRPNYVTDGSNNYGKYTNPTVDEAFDQITGSDLDRGATDPADRRPRSSWSTTPSASPSSSSRQVTAWNSTKVNGVSTIPLSPAVFYNFWEWTPVS